MGRHPVGGQVQGRGILIWKHPTEMQMLKQSARQQVWEAALAWTPHSSFPLLFLPFLSALLPLFNAHCLLLLPLEPSFLPWMHFPALYQRTSCPLLFLAPCMPTLSSSLLLVLFLLLLFSPLLISLHCSIE